MDKRLQVDYIDISDVQWGDKCSLDGDILTINKDELLGIIDTSIFETSDIIVAKPGEHARICGYADCTQPRVNCENPDASFPGIWGKLAPAGHGTRKEIGRAHV